MPEVAFIITLNLQDVSLPSLESTAENLGHSLINDGFDVVDAKAYPRPSLQMGNLMQRPEPQQDFGVGLQGLSGF